MGHPACSQGHGFCLGINCLHLHECCSVKAVFTLSCIGMPFIPMQILLILCCEYLAANKWCTGVARHISTLGICYSALKCMLACCREDNNCLENSNDQEGFANGHIMSVITAQTIGKPTAVPFPALSTLHTSLNIVCLTCMLVRCMSKQKMGLVCEPARRSDLYKVISCLAALLR